MFSMCCWLPCCCDVTACQQATASKALLPNCSLRLQTPPPPPPCLSPCSTIREDIDKKRLQKQGVITKTVGSPKPQPPTPAPQADEGPNYAVAAAVALLVPLVAWLVLSGGQ